MARSNGILRPSDVDSKCFPRAVLSPIEFQGVRAQIDDEINRKAEDDGVSQD